MSFRVSSLKKTYRRRDDVPLTVLDIDFLEVKAGNSIAITGPSGSGKSTLLNILAGVLRADSGSIDVAGQNLSLLSEGKLDRFRAETLGYVFQEFNLFQGLTALQNVLAGGLFSGKGKDTQRAKTLLERVGLGDRAAHMPRELSVGQRQRVAVARALFNRPKLVLGDEPTGNLDEHSGAKVLDLLFELAAECGSALAIVTHDAKIFGRFQRLVRLEEINRAFKAEVLG